MKIHPLSEAFPSFDPPSFDVLVASIKSQGLRLPITTHEGMILDGRNRYRACLEAGVEPRFVEYTGSDPVQFVVDMNLNRRQLSTSQRAAIAAELANLQHGSNRYGKKVEGSFDPSTSAPVITVEEAAKLMNVSRPTVVRAKARMHADPEAHAAAKAGHKPPKKEQPKPTAEEQAEVSREIQQMALDRGISWANKGDVISKAIRDVCGAKVLRTVDLANPTVASKVTAVLDGFRGRSTEEQYQAHRQEVSTLSETAQQKFERLVAREMQLLRATFEQEVRDEAKRRLPEIDAELRAAKADALQELVKHATMRKGIAVQISEDDYRFLLNVLHPDRAPADRKDKFARAFDIVRKLDAYIEACKA